MREFRAKIDPVAISLNTNHANYYIKRTLELAEKFRTDPDKKQRVAESKCKFCYYAASHIGGAAMTDRQCGLCDDILYSGSTCIDSLCKRCAEKNDLCIECAGDIHHRTTRRSWVSLKPTETLR